jgi:uncharacterized protein YfaT (DUF1175 family)
LTAKEAKEKTLYFWRYIVAHPKIKGKADLPKEMFEEIRRYARSCPMCEFHQRDCRGCILYQCAITLDHPYQKWLNAKTNKERQQAANELVAKVEAWEV